MTAELTTIGKALLAATTRRLRAATEELRAFVDLDTSSHDREGLRQAAQWIGAQLRSLGMSVEEQDGGAPIVIGRMRGSGRHRFLLLAHFDTVFDPGEPGRRPFRIEGERAFGPGVADMKGGVVTAWEAL
ncbi:MAG TPA: M20/M25/M40 family metallo-hydrolase, partial [bacterium]|nr:M20/M25/M40 family metallo-hydrolase [bacterium]